uniref:Uncharacterized protein n=1 Tax=viral metagenome TaxID=1070528 RepID=A0A6M3J080_9ZZZZ
MFGEIRTGLIVSADGGKNPPRSDRQGALVVSQDGGKYEEPGLRKQLCFSYSAARATSVPATAQIGNIIWNPPGSGVNLSLCKWSAQIQVTSATTLGITLGYSAQASAPTTTTVADSYGSTFLDAGAPGRCAARAYAIATLLVVPTVVMNLFHNTAAIATTGIDQAHGDLDGMFVIPPGYIACFSAITAAVAAVGMTSTITWKEIPV